MTEYTNCLNLSDEDLVRKALTQEEYFTCLIRRYEKRLLTYIKRLANLKADEAEDILQETFIKIFYNLNDFDAKLKFSSWAYRITHNTTIDFLRQKKAKYFISLTEVEWQNIKSQIDLQEAIYQKLDSQAIKALINNLEQKYQDVLVLKFLEDYSYEEISDILQKPMGTIAALINRAKKKLKQELLKNNF